MEVATDYNYGKEVRLFNAAKLIKSKLEKYTQKFLLNINKKNELENLVK